MDPITQGALGAAVTQSVVGRRVGRRAWWLGAWGGMAADLDVLIRWPGDPMVALTFHRHFTHSLAFIPIGGLLCALPFMRREWARADRKGLIAATTLGYATHALLDAFTSYGTLLAWPFSDTRVAWNVISIIDPLYTLPLLFGAWLTRRQGDPKWARVGFALASIYMALCGLQRYRVRDAQAQLLASRGHRPEARLTFPLFATNRRWRSLYRLGDTFYADAFDVPWWSAPRYLPGTTARAFDLDDAPAPLRDAPKLWSGLETVNWFTQGRMVLETLDGEARPDAPGYRVCDLRYSSVPEGFQPVFCFDFHPEPAPGTDPVRQGGMRTRRIDASTMAKTFPGLGDPGWRELP